MSSFCRLTLAPVSADIDAGSGNIVHVTELTSSGPDYNELSGRGHLAKNSSRSTQNTHRNTDGS